MPSPPLVLPGVLFVGEDDRARVVAHTGPAAGWFVPKGTMGWSHEVAVVAREALTEDIRRSAKLVMPEEQIPPARMPLTTQAAQKSPLVAVASKLAPKLVEAGIRVHTLGVDRVTSSFYYLAEGGGEEAISVSGDLVAAVGAMLGERADNAAIERVLDGLVDRLVRALSRDRVSELSVELAAALPRAAHDGTGLQDVELDAFEAELAKLVGQSEKYGSFAKEISTKLADTNERRIEVPLYTEARKVSQGPFDIMIGDRKVSLPTYERWVMQHPLTEPAKTEAARPAASPKPAPVVDAKAAAEKAAAEKAAAEKAAAEKAAAAQRAAEKAAAEKAAAEKAAAEKAAAEKAAAEKAAAEKAAAEKAAAEKAAAEKAAAEKAAAEKAAAEKAAAEKAAAEKAAAEKAAAEKKADEERAAAEKEKADEERAAEKKSAAKKAAVDDDEAKPVKKKAASDDQKIQRQPEKKGSAMTWIALVLLVVAGVVVWRVWLQH